MSSTIYNGGTGSKVLTPAEAGYLAGFMDGEGSLTIGRARKPAHRSGYTYIGIMTASNTDLDALHSIVAMCGGGKVQMQDKRSHPLHRPTYRTLWSHGQIRELLPQIQPYLLIKRQQAELLLEFLNSKVNGRNATAATWQRQESLRARIRSLNRRGITDTSEERLTVRDVRERVVPRCSIDGCGDAHYGHGLCYAHYYQQVIRPKREAERDAVDRERTCEECGVVFRLTRSDAAVLCSRKCRARRYYREHAERIKAQVAAAKKRRRTVAT